MQFPCEILVRTILPAIRAIMVRDLHDQYGKTQKEIAELLGITQPSVSYYLSGDRGVSAVSIIKESKCFETLHELTSQLVNDEIDYTVVIKEICSICLEVRPTFIKKLYPDKDVSFLEDWHVCFVEE